MTFSIRKALSIHCNSSNDSADVLTLLNTLPLNAGNWIARPLTSHPQWQRMEHASPEDYDDGVSDGESVGGESAVKQESSPASPSSARLAGEGKKTSSAKSAAHLQKRRRVTRACDECRRKKIKCDGKQPCTHCTVYSYGMHVYRLTSKPRTCR